jgi:hypothetical protein
MNGREVLSQLISRERQVRGMKHICHKPTVGTADRWHSRTRPPLPRDTRREPRARSLQRTGIMEPNEQVIFPPLSCYRYPAAAHSLPDLPPHCGLPARQSQRCPDRALPPDPSRSTRPSCPVASAPPAKGAAVGCLARDEQKSADDRGMCPSLLRRTRAKPIGASAWSVASKPRRTQIWTIGAPNICYGWVFGSVLLMSADHSLGASASRTSPMIRRRGMRWRGEHTGAALAQWLSPAPPGASWGK